VLFVGRDQEKALVWRTQRRYNPAGEPYAWLVRSTAFINYFYGTVKLVSCLVAAKIGGRDRCIAVVQGTPLPGRDHRPLRVAITGSR
jgi:hypothetical protein